MFCLLLCALCVTARADTVKLNDGTAVEGDIVSENDTQLIINAQFANGTITEIQTLNKSDIAQITRLTPEQKAAREADRAYLKLQKYQLDPNYSFTLDQYDQVIDGVFQPFLTQYANSPRAADVRAALAQWQADRDQVAAGKARYKGQWMDAAAAAGLLENDRTRHLFDLGNQDLAAQKFKEARDAFAAIIATAKDPKLVDNAQDLYTQASEQWLAALQQQRQALDAQVGAEQDHLHTAQHQRDDAEHKLKEAIEAQKNSPAYLLGDAAIVAEDRADFDRAHSDCDNTQVRIDDLRSQETAVDQQINDLQNKLTAATPPAHAPPPTFWDRAFDWMKKNWIFATAGGLIGLWAVTRLLQ